MFCHADDVQSVQAGLIAGVFLLQCSPALMPQRGIWACAVLVVLSCAWLFWPWRPRRHNPAFPVVFLTALLAGALYADLRAQRRLSGFLESNLEGRPLIVTGVVASLPETTSGGIHFMFRVDTSSAPAGAHVPGMVSMGWFHPSAGSPAMTIQPGQVWRLTCRLKRPHGLINPGGFDFETWSLENGVRAVGTVVEDTGNSLLFMSSGFQVEKLRAHVRNRLLEQLEGYRWKGVMVALVVGDQSLIAQEDWKIFWATGVGHLISISGLHITLLAGLVSKLTRVLWPSVRVRWVAAWCGALGYALLAGFSIPTQRTLYMMTVVLWARVRGNSSSTSRVLSGALTLTFLMDPWAPLSAGFWLSFGAVSGLMLSGSYRVNQDAGWKSALHTQWVATWVMVPLLMVLFGQISLISPFANAVAIPVVSFLVVPLELAGSIPGLGFLLKPGHGVFQMCAGYLAWLGHFPWATWNMAVPSIPVLVMGVTGIGFLLAPRGWPGRWAGMLGLPVLLVVGPQGPGPGEASVIVFDVGQGLAVLVRTQTHALLYDTGPRYGMAADSASRTLLPALRSMGIHHLDGLVLSHRVSDHSGGLHAVLQALPPGWVLSSLMPGDAMLADAPHALPCLSGQTWTWDQVVFEVMFPARDEVWDKHLKTNDRGCVLRVSAQGRHVLLPADIGRSGERKLLERQAGRLSATVLIAPHHGSRTSSGNAFLEQVRPVVALFSTGYRNRFGHPHVETLERYREHHVRIWRTDQSGALHVDITDQGMILFPERALFPHYWEARGGDDQRPFRYTSQGQVEELSWFPVPIPTRSMLKKGCSALVWTHVICEMTRP